MFSEDGHCLKQSSNTKSTKAFVCMYSFVRTGSGTELKLQYFRQLMGRAHPLEKIPALGKIESRKRRGRQRMRWWFCITDSVDVNLNNVWPIEEDREGWCAVVYGIKRVTCLREQRTLCALPLGQTPCWYSTCGITAFRELTVSQGSQMLHS